jgi:hypothetical protein
MLNSKLISLTHILYFYSYSFEYQLVNLPVTKLEWQKVGPTVESMEPRAAPSTFNRIHYTCSTCHLTPKITNAIRLDHQLIKLLKC